MTIKQTVCTKIEEEPKKRTVVFLFVMPYRIMCNGVNREGVKARSDLAY